jgi:hypothetical protein
MTKTHNDNQQTRRQWVCQFASLTGYQEEDVLDSMLRIRKLHEYRYNPSAISSLVSFFQAPPTASAGFSLCSSDESESSSSHSHHYTLPYSDICCLNPSLLPRKEKEYHFTEKAVSLPSSASFGSSSNVTVSAPTISGKVHFPSPSSSFNYVPTIISTSTDCGSGSGCSEYADSLSSESTYDDEDEE